MTKVLDLRHNPQPQPQPPDPGSAYYDDAGGGFAPSSVNGVCRSRIQDQIAVAVAVAGLTKRFFNHIQKDFLINVWGYRKFHIGLLYVYAYLGPGKVLRAQIKLLFFS